MFAEAAEGIVKSVPVVVCWTLLCVSKAYPRALLDQVLQQLLSNWTGGQATSPKEQ